MTIIEPAVTRSTVGFLTLALAQVVELIAGQLKADEDALGGGDGIGKLMYPLRQLLDRSRPKGGAGELDVEREDPLGDDLVFLIGDDDEVRGVGGAAFERRAPRELDRNVEIDVDESIFVVLAVAADSADRGFEADVGEVPPGPGPEIDQLGGVGEHHAARAGQQDVVAEQAAPREHKEKRGDGRAPHAPQRTLSAIG